MWGTVTNSTTRSTGLERDSFTKEEETAFKNRKEYWRIRAYSKPVISHPHRVCACVCGGGRGEGESDEEVNLETP